MSSSSYLSDSEVYELSGIIVLPDGGCPIGTVPIQRITNKDDTEKYHVSVAGDNEYVRKKISILHTSHLLFTVYK